MDLTSLAPIYMYMQTPTSLTPSRSAYAVRRMAVLASSCIFRKEGRALGEGYQVLVTDKSDRDYVSDAVT
jgi:hypothetical protein